MSVHARLGVAVLVVAVVGVVLVLWSRRVPQRLATVRVYARLCAAAAAAEALLGVLLLLTGARPGQGIHLFYGAATVIPVPAADLLARRVRGTDEFWVLLAGTAAMVLMAFRAVTTGGG